MAFALLGAGRLREAREHLGYGLASRARLGSTRTTPWRRRSARQVTAAKQFQPFGSRTFAPDDTSALSNLGAALREAGEPAQAVAYLQRALQMKSDDAASHKNLGKALLQLGRPAEAIEQFRQALQIDGDDTDARRQLERALTAPQGVEPHSRRTRELSVERWIASWRQLAESEMLSLTLVGAGRRRGLPDTVCPDVGTR